MLLEVVTASSQNVFNFGRDDFEGVHRLEFSLPDDQTPIAVILDGLNLEGCRLDVRVALETGLFDLCRSGCEDLIAVGVRRRCPLHTTRHDPTSAGTSALSTIRMIITSGGVISRMVEIISSGCRKAEGPVSTIFCTSNLKLQRLNRPHYQIKTSSSDLQKSLHSRFVTINYLLDSPPAYQLLRRSAISAQARFLSLPLRLPRTLYSQ